MTQNDRCDRNKLPGSLLKSNKLLRASLGEAQSPLSWQRKVMMLGHKTPEVEWEAVEVREGWGADVQAPHNAAHLKRNVFVGDLRSLGDLIVLLGRPLVK
jgi:hypothetical protein